MDKKIRVEFKSVEERNNFANNIIQKGATIVEFGGTLKDGSLYLIYAEA